MKCLTGMLDYVVGRDTESFFDRDAESFSHRDVGVFGDKMLH